MATIVVREPRTPGVGELFGAGLSQGLSKALDWKEKEKLLAQQLATQKEMAQMRLESEKESELQRAIRLTLQHAAEHPEIGPMLEKNINENPDSLEKVKKYAPEYVGPDGLVHLTTKPTAKQTLEETLAKRKLGLMEKEIPGLGMKYGDLFVAPGLSGVLSAKAGAMYRKPAKEKSLMVVNKETHKVRLVKPGDTLDLEKEVPVSKIASADKPVVGRLVKELNTEFKLKAKVINDEFKRLAARYGKLDPTGQIILRYIDPDAPEKAKKEFNRLTKEYESLVTWRDKTLQKIISKYGSTEESDVYGVPLAAPDSTQGGFREWLSNRGKK